MRGGGTERRQKRIAIGGAVVLLALIAFQGPRTLKLLRGTAPTPATQVTAAPAELTPSPPTAAVPVAVRRPGASSRFRLKDPFVPRLSTPPALSVAAATATSPGPSLLAGSRSSYAEASTLAASPGPSLLSGVPADEPGPQRQPPADGGSAQRYTVILSSVPISAGRPAAERAARRFRRAGLPKVGILVSSTYRSLRGGYYVVHSGSYTTAAGARQAAARARADAPGAYMHGLRLQPSESGL